MQGRDFKCFLPEAHPKLSSSNLVDTGRIAGEISIFLYKDPRVLFTRGGDLSPASPFLKVFLTGVRVSRPSVLVDKLLQRGNELLRQKPVDYINFWYFLDALITLVPTPLWDPLLLDGGVDMILRIFSALSEESHITAGWSLSLNLCFNFFERILMTMRGYPFLVKMVKGGFVTSFKCSQNFDKLDAEKREICKSIVAEKIPGYFHLYPVLKCMSSALEKIAVSERQKLRRTFIEADWTTLEALFLERLVLKKIYDMSDKTIGGLCFAVRLDLCRYLRVLTDVAVQKI